MNNDKRVRDIKPGDVIQVEETIAWELTDDAVGIPESEVAERVWLAVIDVTRFDETRFALTLLFDQADGETATIYLSGGRLVNLLDA